jgi:hypothetical protein
MTTPPDAESAVRRYLEFLADPSSLVDHEAVASIEAELAITGDPIAKLRLYSRLEHARAADGEAAKLAFIVHAKSWAEGEGITVTAFSHLGVPDDVLRAAGFLGSGRARARSARPSPGDDQKRARARAVSTEQIKVHVLGRQGSFTLSHVMDDVGGSPLTVRKAVEELVQDGKVRRLGPDPAHAGRGRAPIVYEAC